MQTAAGPSITWISPVVNDYQVIAPNVSSNIVGISVETNISGSVNFTVSVYSGMRGKSGTFLGNLTGSSLTGRRRSTVSMVNVVGSVAVVANQFYSLVFQFTSNSGGSGPIGITNAQYPSAYFYNSINNSTNTNVIFTLSMRLFYSFMLLYLFF